MCESFPFPMLGVVPHPGQSPVFRSDIYCDRGGSPPLSSLPTVNLPDTELLLRPLVRISTMVIAFWAAIDIQVVMT